MNDWGVVSAREESRMDSYLAAELLNKRGAMEHTAVADLQYIPLYRELREKVRLLAQRAESCICGAPERSFHLDVARAIDSVMGFASGRPAILTGEQRRLLADLQSEFSRTLRQSLNAGERHRQAVEKAKRASLDFLERAGRPLAMDPVAA
ncbi:hypothetical protein EV691_12350 [Azotobacter chroococcum]|jgi:hypothetical protein|uniref:Uncharacterized protein n=2 Tax=Azotobacter chroococcum TaxID=353 RepID=A0A4R1PHX5_9GAMM|nr:hypothetical protein EV691_12350 [Azotobacter chroococcum]